MRFAILLLPLLELFSLIELGVRTSALTAVVYVLVTMLLGVAILQRQGRGMIERLRHGWDERAMGPEWLLDGMAMGIAGLLLIVPGIISDLAALILLIGPLRRRLARFLPGSRAESFEPERPLRSGETIEGVFRHLDDDKSP